MTAAAASSGVPQSLRDTLLRLVAAGFAGGVVDFIYPSVMAVSRCRSG